MADAARDQNRVTVLLATDDTTGETVPVKRDASGRILCLATTSGGGDVVGPASSTDNAITRFDGITGKLLKNSTVILDNSGNLTAVGNITGVAAGITISTATNGNITLDPGGAGVINVGANIFGPSGGLVITGGTGSGDDIRITSTSNATKGTINLGNATTGVFIDETVTQLVSGSNITTVSVFGFNANARLIGAKDSGENVATMVSIAANSNAEYFGLRSNGTLATPTVVANDDTIFQFGALGYDGTTNYPVGTIDFAVDGVPGASDMPGRIVFNTTPNGAAFPEEAMRISNTKVVTFSGANIAPATSDASALGTTSLMWSDLFLASGGVINFNNGDVTITHSANALDIDGGVVDFGSTPTVNGTNIVTTALTASTTQSGIIEIATASETTTGTDATRAVSPDGLAGSDYGIRLVEVQTIAAGTAVATGDGNGNVRFFIPSILNGWNLVSVAAAVVTAGTTNTTDIQIHNVTQAADMLSTKITIDSGEKTSYTAATPPVIDGGNDDVATGDEIRFDVDAISTTPPQGLVIILGFQLP